MISNSALNTALASLENEKQYIMKQLYEYRQSVIDSIMHQNIRLTGFQNEIEAYMKDLKTQRENNQEEFNKLYTLEDSMYNISQFVKLMFDIEQLNNSLSNQDEQDRNSIALWASSGKQKYDDFNQNEIMNTGRSVEDIWNTTENNTKQDYLRSSIYDKYSSSSMKMLNSKLESSENKNDSKDLIKVEPFLNESLVKSNNKTRSFVASMRKRSLPDIKSKSNIKQNSEWYKNSKSSTDANGIISIEKKWLSCTNHNVVVMKAFKMACLAYSPSKVKFRENTYTRHHLVIQK